MEESGQIFATGVREDPDGDEEGASLLSLVEELQEFERSFDTRIKLADVEED